MLRLEELRMYVASLPSRGIPAVALRVWRDHGELLHCTAGYMDYENTVPVSGEDYYWFYSVSKPITCTAVMQLAEGGMLGLDDPVAKYLPEWENVRVRRGDGLFRPDTPVTIRHLLSMQAGMNYDMATEPVKAVQAALGPSASTRRLAAAMAESPLEFEPGSRFQYSLCHDILGAVIEAVSGMQFGEYLRKHILKPCGAEGITFHPDAGQIRRMTAQYRWNPDAETADRDAMENSFRLSDAYESGGAGLAGRTRDYIRFADAMACGGVGCVGERILRQTSIDLMRQGQLNEVGMADFSQMQDWHRLEPGYSYGLGVRAWQLERRGELPCREFGWDGAGGCYVLIDPAQRLSAFFAMQVRDCMPAYRFVHRRIREMIYAALAEE